MFIGAYDHSVDAKGRVSVPAKYRNGAEGEKFYVTKGTTDKCLFVYPEEEWKKICDKLEPLPTITNRKVTEFVRGFTSAAYECEVDKLGRINLPLKQREYAGIEKNVKILGVRNRFEIWDAEKWQRKEEEFDFESMLETMSEIGLDF